MLVGQTKQHARGYTDPLCNNLYGLKTEVPLTPLQSAYVRAVNHKQFSELFLSQAPRDTPPLQGFTHLHLKLTDRHKVNSAVMLLFNLQTYK